MKEKGLLLYIINHCVRVEEKMKTIDKKDFDSSEDIQEIVCFNILQIGELAKGLDSNFTNIHDKVPWKSIKGMRDRMVHGYGTIYMDRVWETAIRDVKPLREYCQKILDEFK